MRALKQGKTTCFACYKVEVMRNMTDLLVCRNVLLAVWLFPARKLLENKADKWLFMKAMSTLHVGLKKGAIYDYHHYVCVICTRDLLSVMPIRFQMHLRLFGPAPNPCSSLDSVWWFYLNALDRFENDCTDLAGFLFFFIANTHNYLQCT